MTDKFLSALSLARRAGALKTGFDAVNDVCKNGTAALVMVAADTSGKTVKRVQAACPAGCKLVELPYTQQQIAAITIKAAGVLAVINTDLAALCLSSLKLMTEAGAKEEPV